MKRKNLLITTIGEFDCLPSWIVENRNYDIALIYYPDNIDAESRLYLEEITDYLFFEKGFKYSIIQKVMADNPQLRDYDFFWMPDHDVLFKKGDVNHFFDFLKLYQFDLAQPSLVNKNRSWKILVNKRGCLYRNINIVEVMCPAFSKKALGICLETFSWSKSGWGLGLLWGKLILENKAVIDNFIVEHTKKMDVDGGSLYKKLFAETGKTPEEERDFLVEKYDLETSIKLIKKVPRNNSFFGIILNWFN